MKERPKMIRKKMKRLIRTKTNPLKKLLNLPQTQKNLLKKMRKKKVMPRKMKNQKN